MVNLVVEGMSCAHCVRAVREALLSVPGVSKAEVDLEAGRARVEGEPVDIDRLVQAVEDEGYRAKPA